MLITRQLELEELKKIKFPSPKFKIWKCNVEIVIEKVFGEKTRHIDDFNEIKYSSMALGLTESKSDLQKM